MSLRGSPELSERDRRDTRQAVSNPEARNCSWAGCKNLGVLLGCYSGGAVVAFCRLRSSYESWRSVESRCEIRRDVSHPSQGEQSCSTIKSSHLKTTCFSQIFPRNQPLP